MSARRSKSQNVYTRGLRHAVKAVLNRPSVLLKVRRANAGRATCNILHRIRAVHTYNRSVDPLSTRRPVSKIRHLKEMLAFYLICFDWNRSYCWWRVCYTFVSTCNAMCLKKKKKKKKYLTFWLGMCSDDIQHVPGLEVWWLPLPLKMVRVASLSVPDPQRNSITYISEYWTGGK